MMLNKKTILLVLEFLNGVEFFFIKLKSIVLVYSNHRRKLKLKIGCRTTIKPAKRFKLLNVFKLLNSLNLLNNHSHRNHFP
jgi:hypothetical protein